jgi:GTP-binding protein
VPPDGDPRGNYEAVRAELESYGAGLAELPELVVLSKSDLLTAEEAERMGDKWDDRLSGRVLGVLSVSSATGAHLEALANTILAAVPERAAPARAATGEIPEFEAEHRVYRPAGEGGYRVEREGGGAYRVEGRGVEMLFERHDLTNAEALAYLEQRLTEMGVLAALRDAGFEPGDELRIGEHEFELHPGN